MVSMIQDRKRSNATTDTANMLCEIARIKLLPIHERITTGVELDKDWAYAVAISKLLKDIAPLTSNPEKAEETGNEELTDEELQELEEG